jgi:hypothetical protein
MIWFLVGLNVAAAVFFAVRTSLSRAGVEVSHGLLFATGFLFYWILPLAVGEMRAFADVPVMHFWYRAYDAVPARALKVFLVFSLVYCLAFFAGSEFGTRVLHGRSRHRTERAFLPFSSRLVDLFLLPAMLGAAALVFSLRGSLFRGYNVAEIDTRARGPLVAISLVLLSLAFLYVLSRRDRRPDGFFASIRNRYFAAYFAVAFLILTMGGRLYFVSSLLMLLVFRTVYFGRLPVRRLAGVLLLIAAASGLAGIVRFGGPASGFSVLLNVGAESLFTSFSLLGFLREANFPVIHAPVLLLSSLVNLLPRFVFPAKETLMLTPADLGYTILAPLGALNSFVSFVINFGTIGTVVVLFGFGALLGWLRTVVADPLNGTVYIMVSGWLTFTFFRDPFSVSLVKVMFQDSILIPCIVVMGLHMATVAAGQGSRTSSIAPVPDEERC